MTNQPTHHVYHVTEKQVGDKGYWTKIGAVWPHKDGKGFNMELELIPVSSGGTMKLTLREPSAKPATANQTQPVSEPVA